MTFNSLVLWLIRSPAHRLVPAGLTELSYTGPISGRPIRLPVQSVMDGPHRILVVAGRPAHKRWWRNFRSPRPAQLVRAGRRHTVLGHVLSGSERADALNKYLAARPASRPVITAETPVIAFVAVAS